MASRVQWPGAQCPAFCPGVRFASWREAFEWTQERACGRPFHFVDESDAVLSLPEDITSIAGAIQWLEQKRQLPSKIGVRWSSAAAAPARRNGERIVHWASDQCDPICLPKRPSNSAKSVTKELADLTCQSEVIVTNRQGREIKELGDEIQALAFAPVATSAPRRKTPEKKERNDNKNKNQRKTRLEAFKSAQQATLQEWRDVEPAQSFVSASYHYDWWMFPIQAAGRTATAQRWQVRDKQEALDLLQDRAWFAGYIKTVEQVTAAYKLKPRYLEYTVRVYKVLQSLTEFLQVAPTAQRTRLCPVAYAFIEVVLQEASSELRLRNALFGSNKENRIPALIESIQKQCDSE